MRKILMVFVALLCLGAGPSKQVTIMYYGPVDDKATVAGQALFAVANHNPPKDLVVNILLDSYGGNTMTGYVMADGIDAVRTKGIVVRCYNLGTAQSMAFIIMAHCSERYAVSGATWMFHYPAMLVNRVFLRETSGYAAILAPIEDRFVKEISAVTHHNEADTRQHCIEERVWTNEQINAYAPGFVKVLDGPINLRVE